MNGLLKAHWGRARPAEITNFGGKFDFTPPFEIANQCEKNCSFTSGEGAGATALLVAVIIICSTYGPFRGARWVVSLVCIASATTMGLRVAMGSHFISDTVFSFLFVILITTIFIRLKRYRSIFGI